jgi:hypothetical protein
MQIVAAVMRATLLALNLFSRVGVLFTTDDVNRIWKSALCFKTAAASSAIAAAIAASVTVNFITLGKGGLNAMLAKVSSIVLTAGLFLALQDLELRASRVDVDGFVEDFDGVAARMMHPGLE